MSTQRYVSTSFWDDPWVCSLDPSEKLLYLYFMTGPLTNIAGVYELTHRRMSFDTGFNTETIERIIKRFSKDGKAYHFDSYIILPSWPKHQKWESRSKIKLGIDKVISSLPLKVREYMVSIGYQYVSNYLEFDLDSELELDIDIDIEAVQTDNLPSLIDHWNNKGNLPRAGQVFNIPNPSLCLDTINGFGFDYVKEAIDNISENKDAIGKFCPDFLSLLTKGKIGHWHDWKDQEDSKPDQYNMGVEVDGF